MCKQRKQGDAKEPAQTGCGRTGYNSPAYVVRDHRAELSNSGGLAPGSGQSIAARAAQTESPRVTTSPTPAKDVQGGRQEAGTRAGAERMPAVAISVDTEDFGAQGTISPLDVLPATHAGGDDDLAAEAALVARLRAGDARAFEELVRDVGPRLYAVAKRFLSSEDDAREAMQDAMLSAYRSLDRFDERSRLSTWLHRIVVNASLMKLRTKRRKPSVSLEGLGSAAGSEDGLSFAASVPSDAHGARTGRGLRADRPTLEETDLRDLLRQQMERLPDEYRTVLLLRDVEELDTLQTARVLGVSESAVKTRLHRARLALREAMLLATGKDDTRADDDASGGAA